MFLYLHHRNSELFFHPAKFDNLKDEKISDYKTVSVAQSNTLINLLDCWSRGIMSNDEGRLFMFWGANFFIFLKKIF